MTTYTIRPTLQNLHGRFSRDLKPVLAVSSDDIVQYRTLEAGWCNFDQANPYDKPSKLEGRIRELDSGHALCGPVAIEGARAGMTLEVRLNKIRPGEWGWSSGGGWPGEWNKRWGVAEGDEWIMRWKLNPDALTATNQHGQTIPIRPFLGILGMPPNENGDHSTHPPRYCGGNIDCRELTEGSIVYLPIAVDGGLFSLGDGHAVQGDGEVSGVALECPMELVEVELHLHRNMRLNFPRAHTEAGWITFGFHEDLDEATTIAMDGMLDLMHEQYGFERHQAVAWSSLVVNLHVTQIVNGVKGVHAILPHSSLRGLDHPVK